MTEYSSRVRYVFHAESLEESLMSLTHGDIESWEDMLTDCLSYWTDNDAQKVLSELGLDTTKEGARARLWSHYVDPETRDAVVKSWHAAGHYLPNQIN